MLARLWRVERSMFDVHSSFFFHSPFDVERSMFDVHLFQSSNPTSEPLPVPP
jgi:hypothetical protein